MSTLPEIEAAAATLSNDEKLRLVRFLYQSMPPEQGPLPQPRDFSTEEINGWLDEDERAGREYRERLAASRPAAS